MEDRTMNPTSAGSDGQESEEKRMLTEEDLRTVDGGDKLRFGGTYNLYCLKCKRLTPHGYNSDGKTVCSICGTEYK